MNGDAVAYGTETGKINHQYISVLILVALYYLSYRYPFQINSSGTSATYHDTPLWLAAAKYVVFLATVAFYSLRASLSLDLSRPALPDAVGMMVVIYLFAHAMLATLFSRDPYLFETGIFFAAVIPVYVFRFRGVSFNKLSRAVMIFIYLSAAFELIQLILFSLFDRLPALGWENSPLTRFGSIWDDPNGFAFALIFLIGFVAHKRLTAIKKGILTVALIVMLILTQSFTGIAAGIGALFITGCIRMLYERDINISRSIVRLTCLGCVLTVSAIALINTDLFRDLLYLKSSSISDHISAIQSLGQMGILQFLGLGPVGCPGESGYINMFLNFGLLYLLAYIYVGVVTVRRLIRIINQFKVTGASGIELVYGMLYFLVAFYIGMLNLPLDTVFPLNLLIVIFYILAAFGSKHVLSNPGDTSGLRGGGQ